MNNGDMFKVVDENGVERDAELITIVGIEDKEYAIYSIDRDQDNVNIFVSGLVKDENNNDMLVDIDDVEEKNRLDEIVKKLMKLPAAE
jgi:uncharacterized protein YrzB (UPF0473 family)